METAVGPSLAITCLLVAVLLSISLLTACVSTQQVITGTPLTPINVSEVRIYPHPPASFKEIAILNAASNDLFGITQMPENNLVIQRLKRAAASLGTNGILIRGLEGKQAGTIGDSYGL